VFGDERVERVRESRDVRGGRVRRLSVKPEEALARAPRGLGQAPDGVAHVRLFARRRPVEPRRVRLERLPHAELQREAHRRGRVVDLRLRGRRPEPQHAERAARRRLEHARRRPRLDTTVEEFE
jgi:hypothetical protein